MNFYFNIFRSKHVAFDESDATCMKYFLKSRIKWRKQIYKT